MPFRPQTSQELERRAYWRLLRHLLSEEVERSYKEAPEEELPPQMADLVERLDRRKAKEAPKGG